MLSTYFGEPYLHGEVFDESRGGVDFDGIAVLLGQSVTLVF